VVVDLKIKLADNLLFAGQEYIDFKKTITSYNQLGYL